MSPSFSFGVDTTATPFIKELDRYSGGEGDKVVITGEYFGEQNSKSYVVFSEYFNAAILSWTNEAIEFVVPPQTEIANQLKDVLSSGPLKSVKTIVSLLPISFAGGDLETGNVVSVSVVANGIESNKKEFTYTPQQTYPSWQKQLLNNGLEAIKDIFIGTPKLIGTIGSYLFGSQDERREMLNGWKKNIVRPAQEFIVNPLSEKINSGADGKSTKKDNCDFSHYQIEYNQPLPAIEAIRDKITSLNIGRYSAVNSDGRTIIQIRGNEKDGPLTKAELDKLNKGLAELGVFKPRIFSSLETINGVCGRPNEPIVIDPKDIEKLWENKQEKESITPPNTQAPQLPQAQQGKIIALVISPNGEPVYQAKFWLVDSQGRLVEKSTGGIAYDSVRYTTETGRLETLTVPNGQYTLNIDCAANCMFGDKFAQSVVNDIYAKWSKTLQVEVNGSDIRLDKIILTREK